MPFSSHVSTCLSHRVHILSEMHKLAVTSCSEAEAASEMP